jgi:hypothetical protein
MVRLAVMQIVLAIEKETGIGLQEMASRKQGERLRMARGILTSLAREIGYNMMELNEMSLLYCGWQVSAKCMPRERLNA